MENTSERADKTNIVFLQNKRVLNSLSFALVLLSVFLFAQTIKSLKEYKYVGGGVASTNVINVSGEGEAFAVPDTAEFTFTILEEAKTAAEVQDLATKKANAIIKALVDSGVEEKDIKTTAYNIQPKYEWKATKNCLRYPCEKNRTQVGFSINQSMRVKVRKLDDAGKKLEIVTSKNVSSVSGLTFTIADEDDVMAEARKQAIDEARKKAEVLADDLGVSLVRIVGFSESGNNYEPVRFMSMNKDVAFDEMSVSGASPAVPSGENRIVSNVNITYEIR